MALMPAATAGASQAGSAAVIPLPAIRAVQATAAIAGEAVMAVGEAIRPANPQTNGYIPIRHEPIFRFILVSEASLWNHSKRRFFLLLPAGVLNISPDVDGFVPIDGFASPMGLPSS